MKANSERYRWNPLYFASNLKYVWFYAVMWPQDTFRELKECKVQNFANGLFSNHSIERMVGSPCSKLENNSKFQKLQKLLDFGYQQSAAVNLQTHTAVLNCRSLSLKMTPWSPIVFWCSATCEQVKLYDFKLLINIWLCHRTQNIVERTTKKQSKCTKVFAPDGST